MRLFIWPVATFILLLISGTASIHAQETDPSLEITTMTDLIFPQAVFFEIGIAVPGEDLTRLRLRIQVEGQAEQTLDFITDIPLVFAEEFVVANTSWSIGTDTPPPLFSEITYIWEVSVRGQELRQVEGSLIYEDERLNWVSFTIDDEPVQITAPAELADFDFEAMTARFERVYALLRRETGIQPRINLLLYPEDVNPGCDLDRMGEPVVQGSIVDDDNVDCNLALAERVIERGAYELLSFSVRPDFTLQYLPLMFERFYAPLWATTSPPAWFRSGLQQFYEPDAAPDSYALASQMLRTMRPFTLNQMSEFPDADQARWLAQSRGMVLYISDRIGVDGLFTLARELGNAESFAIAYETAMDEPLSLLLANWQLWLFTQSGISAYNYHPYLGVTPTPLPTNTVTSSPLPVTPSATATEEPTLTATLFVTRTPRPPTATITPRPAEGFIVRATATPLPPDIRTSADLPALNTGQTVVLMLGAGLILGLLLLSWIFRRRA